MSNEPWRELPMTKSERDEAWAKQDELEAEVERLRAENAKIGDVRAENERLRSANASAQRELQNFRDLRDKLEAENAELRQRADKAETELETVRHDRECFLRTADMTRAANVELDKQLSACASGRELLKADIRALKARLAWFEEREPLMRECTPDEIERWEAEHPKPE